MCCECASLFKANRTRPKPMSAYKSALLPLFSSLVRYIKLHPTILLKSWIMAFRLGERMQWVLKLVLTQGLSLSSGHEALTPHCVVIMLLLSLFGYHGAGWCPGQSRGFAFVEFNVIQEATRWMETNQVTLLYTDTHIHIHRGGHMG